MSTTTLSFHHANMFAAWLWESPVFKSQFLIFTLYMNLCLEYFRRCIHGLFWYFENSPVCSEYSPVCGPSTRRYLAPQRVFLLPIETVMSSGWLYFSTVLLNCISQMYFSNVFRLWAVADAPRGSPQICWTSGRLKYFQPTHQLFNDPPYLHSRTCGHRSTHTRISRSPEPL